MLLSQSIFIYVLTARLMMFLDTFAWNLLNRSQLPSACILMQIVFKKIKRNINMWTSVSHSHQILLLMWVQLSLMNEPDDNSLGRATAFCSRIIMPQGTPFSKIFFSWIKLPQFVISIFNVCSYFTLTDGKQQHRIAD